MSDYQLIPSSKYISTYPSIFPNVVTSRISPLMENWRSFRIVMRISRWVMRHACGINGVYNRSYNPSIQQVPISGSGWFSPSSSWKPCIGIIRTIFLFITDIAQPSISILWHPSGDGLKPMRPNKATCFFGLSGEEQHPYSSCENCCTRGPGFFLSFKPSSSHMAWGCLHWIFHPKKRC